MYERICEVGTLTGYRPKRSFGQGNIFTGVCHSVHRGGVCQGGCLPGGGVCQGGLPGGGVCLGGVSARGVSARGGCVCQGGVFFWRGVFFLEGGVCQGGLPGGVSARGVSFFLGGGFPWNTVNVRPVRILLECILVTCSFLLALSPSLSAPSLSAPSLCASSSSSEAASLFPPSSAPVDNPLSSLDNSPAKGTASS